MVLKGLRAVFNGSSDRLTGFLKYYLEEHLITRTVSSLRTIIVRAVFLNAVATDYVTQVT